MTFPASIGGWFVFALLAATWWGNAFIIAWNTKFTLRTFVRWRLYAVLGMLVAHSIINAFASDLAHIGAW